MSENVMSFAIIVVDIVAAVSPLSYTHKKKERQYASRKW